MILFTATPVTLFLSHLLDRDLSKSLPSADSHPAAPFFPPVVGVSLLTTRLLSFSTSLAVPPRPFHPPRDLTPTWVLCALQALLAIAFALSSFLSFRPARKCESQTKKHRRRERERKMEREGKRWGWLSSVLRDAHQSTQSHGRATATVSVKGILFHQWTPSRDYFLQVPRAVSFPVSPLGPFPRAGTVRSAVPHVFQRGPAE